MKKFWVTFGSAHLGGFGLHYYMVIFSPNETIARLIVYKMFGPKWSMIYSDYDEEAYDVRLLGWVEGETEHTYTTHRPGSLASYENM